MMRLRISRILIVVGALLSATTSFDLVEARDSFWQGDVSTDWNTATNWCTVNGAACADFVPQVTGFNARAIIGTDSPNGALNFTSANAPLISAALPTNKATVGGLYLGLRQLDYTFNPPQFVNPAPAAGTLVGKLTITGGALSTASTSEAGFGADGNIVVGADGRGFLTMTGGTLTGQQLLVSGESPPANYAGDALGTSLVDLSGTATLAVNNTTTPVNGTAELDRRLKITGPNAHLTTNGTVTFGSSSSFNAVITSASSPSGPAIIQSGSGVKLGGALSVDFSGAGAIGQTIGNKWNLLSATTGVAGNFSNLGTGNQITVSGLPSAPPTGSAYFVRTVPNGTGKLVQLSYEGVLVLNVNRDTGELKVTNPLGGNIAIDSYQVTSPRGSMLASYAGLGSSTPGAGVWTKPVAPGGNSVTGLFEIKTPDTIPPIDHNDAYDLTSVPFVSLGTGFSRTGVAANIANFGIDGEDLTFEYSSPNGGIQRGQIVYQGTKFENDLVLRVNPNTGQAFIKNDSLVTLKFDGFSVLSTTGDLNGGGFTGLGGSWQTSSPTTANAITQSNLTGSTTLAPGAMLAIGDISSTNFTTAAAQAGLSLQFILSEGLTGGGAAAGDYNGNGVVDAGDYVIWRKTAGSAANYTTFRANFGATGGAALPETTFRVGSVVFDTSAGAGAGTGLSSVPEPSTGWLLLAALGAIGAHQRRRRTQQAAAGAAVQNSNIRETGAFVMKRHISPWAAIALLIFTATTNVESAFATTQGIALTNGDFELPGPVGTKTIAFDSTGAPLNNIPGWTFPGPGVEDFGHTNHAGGDALGDSGTEGGGTPGNEMLLSTFDGVSYQTSAFNVVSIPATQKYQLSFDAHNIFTVLNAGAPTFALPQTELTARLYFLAANGTTRTTIGSPLVIDNVDAVANHSIEFVGGSVALTPALGRPIGVEFDVTSNTFNPTWVQHSWIGVDNVLLQIAGVTAGDLDGDGDIDLADYAIVRDHQQQTQLYKAVGELTGDRFVNLNDFRAFRTLYDGAHGAGSLATALESQVPEPSSLALVLLLGAIMACVKRHRSSIVTARVGFLAITGVVLAAAPATAELLLYDPFMIGASPAAGQYLADAPLGGQNPTLPNNGQYGTTPDLLSGPWVLGGTAARGQSKSPPGLNYIGAPAQGGSIGTVLDTVNNVVDTRVGRYFKPGQEWTDSTVGTYYISWLENFGTITNVSDDMGFRSFEMWKTTAAIGDDNLLGDLGYNAYYHPNNSAQRQAATAHIQFQFQIIDGSPVFFQDGATHLFVMKFNLSSTTNSDVISLYLDPTSVTEPDLPNLAITGTNVQLAALGMGQFGGFGPTLNTVDELRIATTFSDALPQLPIPGDTDGDRDVDLADYNNIITHMGLQVGTALQGDVAKADGTQGSDGRVTIADYRIWKDHYPTSAGSGSVANSNIPEPASWILLSIVVILAAGRGNRRNRSKSVPLMP